MMIVMSMSDYDIERVTLDSGCAEEIMNIGWKHEVDLVSEQLQPVQASGYMAIPDDLATVSAEMFLRKMYSYRH